MEDSLEAADHVLDVIEREAQTLALQPMMGRARPDLAQGNSLKPSPTCALPAASTGSAKRNTLAQHQAGHPSIRTTPQTLQINGTRLGLWRQSMWSVRRISKSRSALETLRK